jgi:ATP sulfurylase
MKKSPGMKVLKSADDVLIAGRGKTEIKEKQSYHNPYNKFNQC